MKLSTIVVAGVAVAGAVGLASSASAAQVFENYAYSYFSDAAWVYVTNSGSHTYTDVTINGTDLGPLAPGASTAPLGVGDPCEGGACTADVLIQVGGHTAHGSFGIPDFDGNVSGALIGTMAAVPEPATWAMMLIGVAGLGAAFRSRRGATATA
jgi:hypothetical protein